MSAGAVFYTKQEQTYVLKFVGDIRYTMGRSLDVFLDQLFKEQDFNNILIDLTEAESIDSTSLGLLAKIANFMRERFGRKTTLVSTNEDINQILDSVGFGEVFTICRDCEVVAQGGQRVPTSEPGKAEMAKTLLEAHSILSGLNEKNRKEFKNVIDALRGELAGKA